MERILKKMSFSMILILASNMQKKSEAKTRTSKRLFPKFMSRLTAYLKKKNDEIPKYLQGKK
tara:strand:- start:138 stop:323 length:186 start_codon:yes stop_codon:yes gene_type:complete